MYFDKYRRFNRKNVDLLIKVFFVKMGAGFVIACSKFYKYFMASIISFSGSGREQGSLRTNTLQLYKLKNHIVRSVPSV